ncbi:RNAse P Rpr2/Rpp21/SNM1 subunit domain-containing protein [Jimgerdemannia flammicorona]|uniref:RNAse P Rpr2/Rpp21/SNM1 subunit domain-containing protein n=1 Tax=Jimgerdemannia flammicorona TaxID=994334 RepID=A0A433PL35_9FUNG|nr:RNAse P Rpr2/Rpp21/SNM1 subunit domain-containing protein [Jimgerdemannia flammicorona]
MADTTHLNFLWSAAHELFAACPQLSAYYINRFQHLADTKDLNLADAVRRQYCQHCSALFAPGVNCRVEIESKRKRKTKKGKRVAKEGKREAGDLGEKKETTTTPNVTLTDHRMNNLSRHIIRFTPLDSTTTTATRSGTPLSSKLHRSQHRNIIVYHCHTCGRMTHFPGSSVAHASLALPCHSTPSVTPSASSSTTASTRKATQYPFTTPTPTPSTSATASTPSSPADARKLKNKKKKLDLQSLLAKEKGRDKGTGTGGSESGLVGFLSSL